MVAESILEQIWRPIPQNLVIADGVAVPLTGVAGIALNGVHSAALHLFYNTNMVGAAILYAVFVRPVEENDVARFWCRPAVQPLAFILEPVYPVSADSELKITMAIKEFARLRGANAGKLGDLDEVQCRAHTLHPALETVPAPVWLAAHIAELGFGNLHQLVIGILSGREVYKTTSLSESIVHDCREVLRVNGSTEYSVDLGNELRGHGDELVHSHAVFLQICLNLRFEFCANAWNLRMQLILRGLGEKLVHGYIVFLQICIYLCLELRVDVHGRRPQQFLRRQGDKVTHLHVVFLQIRSDLGMKFTVNVNAYALDV